MKSQILKLLPVFGYPSEFDVTFDASGHVVDTYKERLDN
jgi:hypothetical protein